MSPVRAFLSLGSNLGDRRALLRDAIDSLPDVVAVSPLYETDPVGGPQQESFLNLVAELWTRLTPLQLLGVCHRIESSAERVRDVRWGPRTLDIDIIWIDGVTMDTERLTIPHPRWKERRFVLAPMRDLAPELVDDRDLQLAHGAVRQVAAL
ncbi:MAG: 2-amino-4-hydroxy-6-hydroxymethyldihydropteridine diphosphokinase [Microthrixaceae bacterium]